ncbi:MAG: amino acid kinase [Gemmatimonadales bacterium]
MSRRLTVIKIGGSLAGIPGALDRVCTVVADAGRAVSIVVVPGGGPFADGVRAFDRAHRLSHDSAHWMALLAMDQYAHVLLERIGGSVMVEEAGAVGPAVTPAGVAVLAPSRWMRAADVLPHTWEATSDSVAAFVAGALDAARLVLIKPAAGTDDLVDECFHAVLPAGLPCTFLHWETVDELPGLLAGRS